MRWNGRRLFQRIGVDSIFKWLAADNIKIGKPVIVVVEPDTSPPELSSSEPSFWEPKLWVNWIPDLAVASSKRIGAGGVACGACANIAGGQK